MSLREKDGERPAKKKPRFPWIALVLLLGSLYFFFARPYLNPQKGPVQVEFVNTTR